MIYYKIPITSNVFTYPAGCIVCRAFKNSTYMYCEFENVKTIESGWSQITKADFENLCPALPAAFVPPLQEIIATSAVKSDSSIVLTVPSIPITGTIIKFKTPCGSVGVNSLVIGGVNYSFIDAMGKLVSDIGDGTFDSGAMLSVIVDVANKKAYIQNQSKATPISHNHSAANITSGTLPVARGGTGATTAAAARTNLGLGGVAVESTVPVAKGGTGATTAANARKNFGITYGTAAPSGTPATGAGAIYFKIVT